MKYRFFLIISVLIAMTTPVCHGLESSSPVEFNQEYPLAVENVEMTHPFKVEFSKLHQWLPDLDGSVGFSGTLDAKLEFSEKMVLTTTVSERYVTKDADIDLEITPVNAFSIIKIDGDLEGSITWSALGFDDNEIDISMKRVDISHAVSEDFGQKTTIVMDEETLYSGTIPVLGIQIEVFIRPVLEYTPTLQGSMDIDGPGDLIENLHWEDDSLEGKIVFSETAPATLNLVNPKLVLDDFSATIEVYMITSVLTIGPQSYELIQLEDYEVMGYDLELIEMEPNNYQLIETIMDTSHPESGLYLELVDQMGSYNQRISAIEDELTNSGGFNAQLETLSNKVDTVESEFDQLENSLGSLSTNINDLSSEITQYSTQVNDQSNQLRNTETSLQQVQQDLDTIENRVTDSDNTQNGTNTVLIIVGGINLLSLGGVLILLWQKGILTI